MAAVLVSSGLASSAMAQGFFIGADVGSVKYPDYTGDVVNGLIGLGAASASARQNAGSITLGIHGGQWVNENFGWEAGYSDLGSVDATVTSTLANGTYKTSASAFHAAVLGGVPLGRGKFYGKAGLFSAQTKLSGSIAGLTFSNPSETSTGLLIGGGYELSFTNKFSGRAGLDLLNGVKFANAWSGLIENQTMIQVALGVNYTF